MSGICDYPQERIQRDLDNDDTEMRRVHDDRTASHILV